MIYLAFALLIGTVLEARFRNGVLRSLLVLGCVATIAFTAWTGPLIRQLAGTPSSAPCPPPSTELCRQQFMSGLEVMRMAAFEQFLWALLPTASLAALALMPLGVIRRRTTETHDASRTP